MNKNKAKMPLQPISINAIVVPNHKGKYEQKPRARRSSMNLCKTIRKSIEPTSSAEKKKQNKIKCRYCDPV